MKTYVIICCFADRIAGGPIYYSNKAKFMEDLGWKVVVIPADTGKKSAVKGLEKYFGPYVPYLGYMPSEFNRKQREQIVSQLLEFVPKDSDEIVIETGTDYTAYWGEVLAERLKAKHVVIFLDEQNPYITKDVISFYKFKYERKELACITKAVMKNLFMGYMDIDLDECISLPCECTNSIEDYEHSITKKINKSNYNIGYIGRLDKPFVSVIIKGFVEFCIANSQESITIVFFGGANDFKIEKKIEKAFETFLHVSVYITGYLYPLPLNALQQMDVFVSGAGSAKVGARTGVYSVYIDALTYKPRGIFTSITPSIVEKCPNGDTLLEYLKWVLVDKNNLPKHFSFDISNDWKVVCESFGQHIEFLQKTINDSRYYDIINMSTAKGKKKRILRNILGASGYERLHKIITAFVKKIYK